MLGPDMPVPPLQAFYSNNNPAPPLPALSRPLKMVARVMTMVAIARKVAVVVVVVAAITTLPVKATSSKTASLAMPCPTFLALLLQSLDWDHQCVPRSGSGGQQQHCLPR
jgi:hypothetical protein